MDMRQHVAQQLVHTKYAERDSMLHCTCYHRIIVPPFTLEYLSYRDYASTAFAATGAAIRQSNALASSRTQVRLNRHDLQYKNADYCGSNAPRGSTRTGQHVTKMPVASLLAAFGELTYYEVHVPAAPMPCFLALLQSDGFACNISRCIAEGLNLHLLHFWRVLTLILLTFAH